MGHREYPNLPRAYIDMDGPIANFEKASMDAGLHPNEFKLKKGAYLALQLENGVREAIIELESMGFYPWILTKSPSKNSEAASEKLHWAAESVPELADRITITSDKGAHGRPGDILIDDHPEWANCKEFGGTVFTYRGDWAKTIAEIKTTFAKSPAFEKTGAITVNAAALAGRWDPAFHMMQANMGAVETQLKSSVSDAQAMQMLADFPEDIIDGINRKLKVTVSVPNDAGFSLMKKNPHLALALGLHLCQEHLHKKREETGRAISELRKTSALYTKLRHLLTGADDFEVVGVRTPGRTGP
jgi:hypothetical protein